METQPPRRGLPVLFWTLLLSPSALALLIFAMGQISEKLKETAFAIGMFGALYSFIVSIYCGRWLATRRDDGTSRAGTTMGWAALIVIVNGIIVFVGCAPN